MSTAPSTSACVRPAATSICSSLRRSSLRMDSLLREAVSATAACCAPSARCSVPSASVVSRRRMVSCFRSGSACVPPVVARLRLMASCRLCACTVRPSTPTKAAELTSLCSAIHLRAALARSLMMASAKSASCRFSPSALLSPPLSPAKAEMMSLPPSVSTLALTVLPSDSASSAVVRSKAKLPCTRKKPATPTVSRPAARSTGPAEAS